MRTPSRVSPRRISLAALAAAVACLAAPGNASAYQTDESARAVRDHWTPERAANFMFVPAYNNGDDPFGEWTAKKIKTTSQWEANENISYDVGMATMHKLNGKTLADKVGKRGIAFNKSNDQDFDAFGYPAEDPFDGEKMYRCDSPSQGTDNDQNNPKPIRIDCNMTGGSSGGGWVIGGEKVNSVVSYGYECTIPIPPLCNNPEEGRLFGPYFGDVIKDLYKSQK